MNLDFSTIELRTLATIRQGLESRPDLHSLIMSRLVCSYYEEIHMEEAGLSAVVSAVDGAVFVRFCHSRRSSGDVLLGDTAFVLQGKELVALLSTSEGPVSGAFFSMFGKSFIRRGPGTSPVPIRFKVRKDGFVEYMVQRGTLADFLSKAGDHALLAEMSVVLES